MYMYIYIYIHIILCPKARTSSPGPTAGLLLQVLLGLLRALQLPLPVLA